MESLIVSSEVFTFTPMSLILTSVILLTPWCVQAHDNPWHFLFRITRWNFLVLMDWFLFFYWILWWAGTWMLSTQICVHQNSFGEAFPCDSPELATLSYVNIFNLVVNAKICRLRCVMLISVLYKMSWREVVMKLKVKNLSFLVKTLWQALR